MGKSCKVVVCGQASVGKTSILEQLLYGNHVVGECGAGQRSLSPWCGGQGSLGRAVPVRSGEGTAFRAVPGPGPRQGSDCPLPIPAGSEMIETQEDIYVGSIETDRGVREQVRFYDTRGLRDGLELPKHCFSCTDGYVLVYSTDSKESFKRVELLKKEIDKSKDKKEVSPSGGRGCRVGSAPLGQVLTFVFSSLSQDTDGYCETPHSNRVSPEMLSEHTGAQKHLLGLV